MKVLIGLIFTLMLSGCAMFKQLVPVKPPPFPEPIKELTTPCPDLKTIEGNQVAIIDLLKVVVENYTMYYHCSLKNEGWNDWYKSQKEIYEKVLRK
jgi:hypothetical protein